MPKDNTSPRTELQKQKTKEYDASFPKLSKPPKADQPPLTIDLSKVDTSKLQNITKGVEQ